MTDDDYLCTATDEGRGVFNSLYNQFPENPSEKQVVKHIQGTSLEYIGQGKSRVVLLDTSGDYLSSDYDCVVKIQKKDAKEQNESEVDTWENIDDDSKKWLVPVTDHDDQYRWVVQPYLDSTVTKAQLAELEVDLLRNGWELEDVNKSNAVRIQNHAAMVDYGLSLHEVDFDVMGLEERIHLKKWKHDQT